MHDEQVPEPRWEAAVVGGPAKLHSRVPSSMPIDSCRRCARCRYVIDRSRIWESSPPVDFSALGDFTAKAMSVLGAKGQTLTCTRLGNPNCLGCIHHKDWLFPVQHVKFVCYGHAWGPIGGAA